MELLKRLAESIATGNIVELKNLIDDQGVYYTTDEQLNVSKSDKQNFLEWIWDKFNEQGIDTKNTLSYEFDQCMHCKIGNPVILFNDGKFPVSTSQPAEKEKIGLMIEIQDDIIVGITLCGSFLHHENPFNFEVRCKKKYGNAQF